MILKIMDCYPAVVITPETAPEFEIILILSELMEIRHIGKKVIGRVQGHVA